MPLRVSDIDVDEDLLNIGTWEEGGHKQLAHILHMILFYDICSIIVHIQYISHFILSYVIWSIL